MDEGNNTNVPVTVAMLSNEFGKDDLASTDDRVHITVSSIDDSPDPFLPQPRAPPALCRSHRPLQPSLNFAVSPFRPLILQKCSRH